MGDKREFPADYHLYSEENYDLAESVDKILNFPIEMFIENKSYDHETGKMIYFGNVGIFWYIDDKDEIDHYKTPLNEEMYRPINQNSQLITPLTAHWMAWVKSRVKYGIDKSYRYYPRGRVNYNVRKDIYEIDMDECLHHNRKFLDRLLNIFDINRRKILITPAHEINQNSHNFSIEGHYRCHLCDKSIK